MEPSSGEGLGMHWDSIKRKLNLAESGNARPSAGRVAAE